MTQQELASLKAVDDAIQAHPVVVISIIETGLDNAPWKEESAASKPKLRELSEKFNGEVFFGFLSNNYKVIHHAISHYKIKKFPIHLIFQNGKEKKRVTDAINILAELEKMVQPSDGTTGGPSGSGATAADAATDESPANNKTEAAGLQTSHLLSAEQLKVVQPPTSDAAVARPLLLTSASKVQKRQFGALDELLKKAVQAKDIELEAKDGQLAIMGRELLAKDQELEDMKLQLNAKKLQLNAKDRELQNLFRQIKELLGGNGN